MNGMREQPVDSAAQRPGRGKFEILCHAWHIVTGETENQTGERAVYGPHENP